MKPSDILTTLKLTTAAQRPTFIWGPPGVGKSDVVATHAQQNDLQLRDVRLNLLDPTDIKGFPVPDTKKKLMTWLPADFLPRDGKGILFLDEFNSAPQSVQAAAYQLTLNRRIGDYELPEGWTIVAAGNRDTDRGATNRMPAPLANRLIHLDFEVNMDDWSNWAIENNVNTELLAFIRFRPNLLHAFDPNQRAFPSPRSWKFVDDLLKQQPQKSIEYEVYKGTVGEGAASEFMAFLRIYRDLPNPDAVIMNPSSSPVPEDPATLYALSTSLAERASMQTFDNIITYADRMPIEFQVVLVRDSLKRRAEVSSTRSFVTWASKHANVLV